MPYNKKYAREYYKKYYQVNKEYYKKYYQEHKQQYRDANKKHVEKLKADDIDEWRRYWNTYNRKRYEKLRNMVFNKLGNQCAKCGFKDRRALQLDHINGGGSRELKEIKATGIYLKILKSENVTDYQLLCANCNWIKRAEKKEY